MLLVASAVASVPTPPPVVSLRVDGLPVPALGVTASPHISATLPSAGATPITALLVTVRREGGGPIDAAGADVWSGNATVGAGGPAVHCGASLLPGASFVVSARWIYGSGQRRPAGDGSFDTGLFAEADWRGAPWVGAGHGEFAANFTLSAADAAARRGRAYVAAPGGALLFVNGELIGSDTIVGTSNPHHYLIPGSFLTDALYFQGVAPWLDWTKQMHSRTHDVSSALQPGANQILLKTGCGAWCPSLAPTCAHSGRMIHTPAGGQPLARLLLTAGASSVVNR